MQTYVSTYKHTGGSNIQAYTRTSTYTHVQHDILSDLIRCLDIIDESPACIRIRYIRCLRLLIYT